MNDRDPLDVLICGAGAAGLTLALELARRGVGFCLIDKIDTPFGGSRGKGIQPRTLEIFEDLGIADRLAAVGGPYPPEREYGEGGSDHVATADVAPQVQPSEPYAVPLMVPQFLTERVLRERLAEFGHVPRYGCELVDLQQDADGVTAQVVDAAGTHSIRARFLVATDGGRSFVRHALAVDFPGKTLGVRAIVADVALRGLDRTYWHRFNEASMQRRVSLCPLAGTDLFQVQAPIPLEGEVDLSAAGLDAMIAERTGRADIRIDQVFWASAYAMNARLADRYRVGRVFLAGDAAHIHPPTGGQGLNTSVQDAYNLGWKLAAVIAGAADALLDSYEQERLPVAADMLGLSVKLLDAARQGDMRRGRQTQQLDLYYDDSVLVPPATSSSRIASGTRAPDAPVLGAAGQATRLFALFKGTHWTLLGYEVEHAALPIRHGVHAHAVGERGDVRDSGGHVADAYGLSPGDVVLVRPDGYIGTTAQVGELHALTDYLAALGL